MTDRDDVCRNFLRPYRPAVAATILQDPLTAREKGVREIAVVIGAEPLAAKQLQLGIACFIYLILK